MAASASSQVANASPTCVGEAERWLSSSRNLEHHRLRRIPLMQAPSIYYYIREASPQYNQRKCPIMKIFELPGTGFSAPVLMFYFSI